MDQKEHFVLTEQQGRVLILTLNRPAVLNAWHTRMREELTSLIDKANDDESVRAIVLTGAGNRAFGAGQDLNETKTFNPDRAEEWIGEWRRLYHAIRSLSKPLIVALNGVAAGSAFQVALLADFRIGHSAVTMGQPEINSGIASTTGPWIMKELLGLARTIDLTLSGRMMDAQECHQIGLINRLVDADLVMTEAIELANELAEKPPVAMRLNKARFQEVTQAGFENCLQAGIRNQRISYGSGEPARMMQAFLDKRAAKKSTPV